MDFILNQLRYQSLSTSATQGIASVEVAGRQLSSGGSAVTVELYLSLDGVLDSQDYRLDSRTLTFNRNSSQTYDVVLNTKNLPIAEGSYTLIARVIPAAGETNTSNNQASLLVNHTNNDAIEIWISTALNAVESAGSKGNGVPPTTGTRLMALLSTAMLDTVAAFYPGLVHYAQDLTAPVGANLTAAIASTARTILRTILPGESAIIDAQYNKALREISATKSTIQRSTDFGANVANTALSLRANDGSTDNTPYSPRLDQGDYVYQPPLTGEPNAGVALGANWGNVTRWVIQRRDPLNDPTLTYFDPDGLFGRPGTADPARTAQFINEIEEVRKFGARSSTTLTTLERTADQSDIALFWAYDRADTFRPYGQLFDIALDVADANPVPTGTGLTTNARLFAALSTALADSVITAWKWKYIEQQPRPWDVITGRIQTGVTGYTIDTNWQSLLSQVNDFESPPFPDYLSGHSAMGGAFASVMSAFFLNNPTFTASSQDLSGSSKVRTFGGSGTFDQYQYQNGFYLAGLEDALSRLYGGVHVREANIDSFNVGDKVGQFVATQFA